MESHSLNSGIILKFSPLLRGFIQNWKCPRVEPWLCKFPGILKKFSELTWKIVKSSFNIKLYKTTSRNSTLKPVSDAKMVTQI